MKKKEAIKDRVGNRLTSYYPSEKIKKITDVGDFPRLIERMWDDGYNVITSFKLAAITADFVYYTDEDESDDTASVVMLSKDLKLVSDNFFAANDLTSIVAANDGLLWISTSVKFWQREHFVQPGLIAPTIKGLLEVVDVKKLTKKEKVIYLAYLNNGPVRYTKPESLMAVLSNDIDQAKYSLQLQTIAKMLSKG